MIKVTCYREDLTIKQIKITGHSNYSDSGSDIVCSAVSTAMVISYNLVEKLCEKHRFVADQNIPVMDLVIEESNEMTNIVLENLLSGLEDIAEQYPNNIKIITNRR